MTDHEHDAASDQDQRIEAIHGPGAVEAIEEFAQGLQEGPQESFVGPGGCVRTLEDLLEAQTPFQGHDFGPTDLIDQMRGYVTQAVRDCAGGERVSFSCFGALVPGPEGQPQSIGVVVLAIPSGVLDQHVTSTSFVPNLWATQEAIEDLVRATIEGLLAERSARLAQSLTAPATPGQDSGGRLLHLPGS